MPEVLEGWITTGDAMEISGYGRARLYQLRRDGKVQFIRVGKTVLYRKDEMEQLKEGRKDKKNES